MLHPPQLQGWLTTQFCGRHLIQLSRVDSTNRILAHWSKQGLPAGQALPAGTAVIATTQTAGRGQRGHIWRSPAGGLYLSVLFYPALGRAPSKIVAPACSLELTLAIAWGVALQLQQQLHLDLRLKWPNDLVLQGRKLGGVLLQSRSTGHSVTAVVAGLGLNINNATPDTGIALQESLGRPLHLAAVAALALQGMENGFLAWQEGGLESVLPSYEHLMLHRQLAIALGGDRGAILGITPTGLLRIGTASGVRTLAPGAISLGYPICNPQSQDR